MQSGHKANHFDLRREIHAGDIWNQGVPYEIQDFAVGDAVKAARAANHVNNLKFRQPNAFTMGIPVASLYTNGFYRSYLGDMRLSEPVDVSRVHISRVYRHSSNYYLIVPETPPDSSVSTPARSREHMVSIDPGIRTFATCYSEDGVLEFGANDAVKFIRLLRAADRVDAKAKTLKARPRRRHKKAAQRIRDRVKNLVTDAHHKIAHALTTRFDNVIIPKFGVKELSQKLSKRNSRKLLTWSHYKFRQRLTSACAKRNCNLYVTREPYTSMTCGACGLLNRGLGASKTFICPYCHAHMDRDVNAARNIFLYTLVNGTRELYESVKTDTAGSACIAEETQ